MATLAETLAEVRQSLAIAKYHLARVDAIVGREELIDLELEEEPIELHRRAFPFKTERPPEEPITLRDGEFAYDGE